MRKVDAVLKYVMGKAGSEALNPEVVADLNNGKLELVENDVIISKKFGAQTFGSTDATEQLLTADTKKQNGISTFQGRNLEETQIVTGISLGMDDAAAATALGAAAYGSTDAKVGAVVRNSELQIIQEGKEFRVPVSKLVSAAASTDVGGNIYQNEAFRMLKPQKEVQVNLLTPGTHDAGMGNQSHVRVIFHGFALRAK